MVGATLSASLSHAEIVSLQGIEFDLTPGLQNDPIARSLRSSEWDGNLEALLAGYNYETVLSEDGRPRRVVVSGLNGSGVAQGGLASMARATEELIRYQPPTDGLPEKYRELTAGSVMEVTLPIDRLNQMKLGEKVLLNLPIGAYEVVHDNRFEHENGDVTWVGYLDSAGKGYRVIITSGRDGSLGQIVTPDAVYNIDLEGGRNWLVDIGSSGLTSGSLENDQVFGDGFAAAEAQPHHAEGGVMMSARKNRANRRTNTRGTSTTTKTTTPTASATTTTSTPATIDLFMLYTSGINAVDTRINYLVAKANQAYVDSRIQLKLRLVGKQLVNYTNLNDNGTALNELTYGRGAFTQVSSLRTTFGADLVSLLRPFRYQSQKSCGVAWVNGANGGSFFPQLGYSVVSDGIDGGGTRYFCADFTLTHELGHNLGSVHDAAHSSFRGAHAFSYGHGRPGVFGTIMSYHNPAVGLFSSPSLTCKGEPCGNANADNVRSINLTAPKVAGFVRATR
jgi:hypothetical protein